MKRTQEAHLLGMTILFKPRGSPCERNQFGIVYLIDVVSPHHGDLTSLHDQKHIIGPGKVDEPKKAPAGAFQLEPADTPISLVDGVQKLIHLMLRVDGTILRNDQLIGFRHSIDLQNTKAVIGQITADDVEARSRHVHREFMHLVESELAQILPDRVSSGLFFRR